MRNIKNKSIIKSSGDRLSFSELEEDVKKLALNESPGLNGMPPNVAKLLDDNNERVS